MPYLDIAGERIFYALHENKTRRAVPLLLVHGAGENHLVWPAGLRRLPEVRVYAPDLPGHGKSGGSGRMRVEAYTEFLLQLLDGLGVARAVIVGHSMGGAIAQHFGLTYPARAAALILIATGARLKVMPELLTLTQSDLSAAADLTGRYQWGLDVPEQIVRLGRKQLLTNRLDVLHGDYQACHAFDLTDRLGEIRVPTLVIGGTADRLTPPHYARLLAERINGAQLALVDGAGHMVMFEREDVVTRAVEQFLRTQGWLD